MKEWAIRFHRVMEPDEAMVLAALYHEDLVNDEVSEIEFDMLKSRVNKTSRYFPTYAEIMNSRLIMFYNDEGKQINWTTLKRLAPCFEDVPQIAGSQRRTHLELEDARKGLLTYGEGDGMMKHKFLKRIEDLNEHLEYLKQMSKKLALSDNKPRRIT